MKILLSIVLNQLDNKNLLVIGPNGSGKSVFLKQVALVIFLGHIGSYVPAEEASIGMVKSIHSRLQTTESVSVRLSSFMIDISQVTAPLLISLIAKLTENYNFQMTRALNYAKQNSLILIDEFGRGTTEEDGISILTGVLKYFLTLRQDCPHILVSTHFQQLVEHLPRSSLVGYLKMNFTIENGEIYFLHKITEGMRYILGM